MPYLVVKTAPPPSPSRVRFTDPIHATTLSTSRTMDLIVNNYDDKFVTITPSKPGKRSFTMNTVEAKKKKRKLDLNTGSMMLEIKGIEYMLGECRTENHLYRDKINDLEAISHMALIHGEEIREYGEKQRISSQHKYNPIHPPAENKNDTPVGRAIIMATVKKAEMD